MRPQIAKDDLIQTVRKTDRYGSKLNAEKGLRNFLRNQAWPVVDKDIILVPVSGAFLNSGNLADGRFLNFFEPRLGTENMEL